MSIIRIHKQKNFSIISNLPLNDPNLSMKARGIWATLLSKPDDWQVYVSQLVKTCKDGKASIYSGLKELKEAGYIEHVFVRDDGGKMVRGEYIVHEEPIEVKTPVNTGPEPYTENRNTVNRDTENPPLLKTNNKLKTDDDKPAPSDPAPKVSSKVSPVTTSSSPLSEDEIIKTLARLFSLVPKQFLKPSVRQTIEKALIIHSEDYAESAIKYTNDHSNGGSWQKYRAYLDKTINHGYADGYQSESQPVDQGPTIDFKKMPDENLRFMANTGNVQAIEELKRRRLSGSD